MTPGELNHGQLATTGLTAPAVRVNLKPNCLTKCRGYPYYGKVVTGRQLTIGVMPRTFAANSCVYPS